ncbi:aldo/keto reductase [Amycolatopsis sp. 195334CR]|uniref:aldo/keto reductase n=1 Tax=Amycolatopsis sp. 195334CR TaxID=2814588 RepID=UPI001A8D4FC4|nr:aldo/keto reductase [Amycolatopsis sp. 195334CR]MBN6039339.1 aldo/keto reductase [Amycolatopsis sp. 195334CR]
MSIALNDEVLLPLISFDAGALPPDTVAGAVRQALAAGYRAIGVRPSGESGAGEAIRELPPGEVFVTLTLPGTGTAEALASGLRMLGTDRIDLVLLERPTAPGWSELARAQAAGQVRALGVAGLTADALRRFVETTGVPAAHRLDLHPREPRAELRALHAEHGIVTIAADPVGPGALPGVLRGLAAKYGKSPAQLVLRWQLELGHAVVVGPGPATLLAEQLGVFDFELAADDLAVIAELEGT